MGLDPLNLLRTNDYLISVIMRNMIFHFLGVGDVGVLVLQAGFAYFCRYTFQILESYLTLKNTIFEVVFQILISFLSSSSLIKCINLSDGVFYPSIHSYTISFEEMFHLVLGFYNAGK